jgi:hypothetical protein
MQSEAVVTAVADAWHTAEPALLAPLFRINLSDQAGVLWDAVSAWLKREERPCDLMSCGAGPVLWIRNGHVIDHVSNPSYLATYAGKELLNERTRGAFYSD